MVPGSPYNFSDDDCLNYIKNAGYNDVFDENKYGRVLNGLGKSGFAWFFSRQVPEKENFKIGEIEFPIIFYNEIYSFYNKKSKNIYKTYLLTWPHDINGQLLTEKDNITPDKFVQREVTITEYNDKPLAVYNKFELSGDTISSKYIMRGQFKTFDQALNDVKKTIIFPLDEN